MTKTDGRFSTVIRASVRKQFFKEANKGKLVNDLLEKYYYLDKPNDDSLKAGRRL